MVTLITKIVIARRAAASAIAAICGLELPLKLWPQIIPVLTNNSSNADPEVKKAALLTLGFICEELVKKKIRNICFFKKFFKNMGISFLYIYLLSLEKYRKSKLFGAGSNRDHFDGYSDRDG